MQIRLDFFDLLLFAVMVSAFVIGLHQSYFYGVAASYWLFMFSILAFLWLNKRMKQKKQPEDPKTQQARQSKSRKKK
jgi:membrane protein implicated in regulation of membrane protease activity